MYRYFIYACVCAAMLVSCGESDDSINRARERIVEDLKRANIYERGNLPDPAPQIVSGYYDIVQRGTYRYIVNEYLADLEERDGRGALPAVAQDDSVSFHFDARIYTGSFDSASTFYTNIEARREVLSNSNADFNPEFWPTTPLRIKVGSDPGILKSVQVALLGCKAAEGLDDDDPSNDAVSDIVRIYLTSDAGFGSKSVYNVPGGSSLVFELSDIKIID